MNNSLTNNANIENSDTEIHPILPQAGSHAAIETSSNRRSQRLVSLPIHQLRLSLTILAIQLLDSMLQYVPERRCSAASALESSYLDPYHDSSDEPVAEQKFDWSFLEAELPVDIWKTVMYAEILGYLGDVSGLETPTTGMDPMDTSG